MRTRDRLLKSTLIPGGTLTFQSDSGPITSPPSYFSSNVDVEFEYETMIDAVGSSRVTKSCDHKSWDFTCHSGTSWHYHSGSLSGPIVKVEGPNAFWFGYSYYPAAFNHDFVDMANRFPVSEEKQMLDLRHDFFSQNQVDNFVNLSEIHEIPSAARSLLSTLRRPVVKAALARRPSVRLSLLKYSNTWLAYSFGIAPLIADMRSMARGLRNFHSDLLKDNARRGKIQTVRSHVKGQTLKVSSGTPSPYIPERFVQVADPIRTMGISGLRTEQYNSSVFKALDYSLRKFGGTGFMSTVWEKIPYSFVVDWFVDLRGILDNMDNLFSGSSMKITDAWVSETQKGCFIGTQVYDRAIEPPDGTQLYVNVLSRYTRKPLETAAKVVSSGRFGKKQLSLLGSLLYQAVANRQGYRLNG